MKIIYLAPSVVPSRSANSIHVMKMCRALAELGHEVTLFVPNHKKGLEKDVTDLYEFYNVSPIFRVKKIPWAVFPGSKYLYSAIVALSLRFSKHDLIYCRDFYPAVFSTLFGVPVVIEFHSDGRRFRGIRAWLVNRFYRSRYLKKVVVISDALKRSMLEKVSEFTNRIVVAHDASDIEEENMTSIGLPGSFKVGYVGHLYEGKGLEVISAIVSALPGVLFHIIGGLDRDIEYWQNKVDSPNILFHGFVNQNEVASYINELDVCLLPNQRIVKDISGRNIGQFTSPLKLFDYMGMGKPIIASDLPVLREVLNEQNAILCDPEKPEDWIEAINKLREDPQFCRSLGSRAKADFLRNYTWRERARKILNAIYV